MTEALMTDRHAGILTSTELEAQVLDRYAKGAKHVEPGLCCPTGNYDAKFLKLLPGEIVEKDYGCGNPSEHVNEDEVVVDLGSGAGKVCYILGQKVGPKGHVIGLDFNDTMLTLACKYQDEMAGKLGYRNVDFRKARIQDMALDLKAAESWLRCHPATTVEHVAAFEDHCDRLRREQPLIADQSVDVVVSNCVLNLVRAQDKAKLFGEIYRVLNRSGRAVISDIVCDEDPTPAIRNDPKLWSGCIAGAFREDVFLEMFEKAGFHGIEILDRTEQPWQVIDGIEFRSITVRAFKGKEGSCLERNQAVIYRGPWKMVKDDDGHVLRRGRRTAVCGKTFQLLTDPNGPYADHTIAVPPREVVPLDQSQPFGCGGSKLRASPANQGCRI